MFAPACMDADAMTKVVWLLDRPPLRLLEKVDASAFILSPATRATGAEAAA